MSSLLVPQRQEGTSTNFGLVNEQSLNTVVPSYITPSLHVPQQRWVFNNSYSTMVTTFDDYLEHLKTLSIEAFITQIKEKVCELPTNAEMFLRANEMLVPYLNGILSTINERLALTEKTFSGIILRKWSDIEIPDMENIEIIVKVEEKEYSMLLKLWEEIDQEIYQKTPLEISEKLVIIFETL